MREVAGCRQGGSSLWALILVPHAPKLEGGDLELGFPYSRCREAYKEGLEQGPEVWTLPLPQLSMAFHHSYPHNPTPAWPTKPCGFGPCSPPPFVPSLPLYSSLLLPQGLYAHCDPCLGSFWLPPHNSSCRTIVTFSI